MAAATMEADKTSDSLDVSSQMLCVPQWSLMPPPKKNAANNNNVIDPSFSITEESIDSDVLRVRDLDALTTPRRAGGILRASDTPGTGQSVRFGMRLYDNGDESKFSASDSAIRTDGDDSLNLPTLGGYSNLHDESFESQGGSRAASTHNRHASSSAIAAAAAEESLDESFMRAEVARAKRAMMAEDEDVGEQSDFGSAPSSRPSAWGTPRSTFSGDGSVLLSSPAEQDAADCERESSDEKETDHGVTGIGAALVSAAPKEDDVVDEEDALITQAIESLDTVHAERANMLSLELKRAHGQIKDLLEMARLNDEETKRMQAASIQEKEAFATRMQEMKNVADTLQTQLARRNRSGMDTTSDPTSADERLQRVVAEKEALEQALDRQTQELKEVKQDLAHATEQVEFDADDAKADREMLEQEIFSKDEQLFDVRNEVASLTERLSVAETRAAKDEEGFRQELEAKEAALSEAHQELMRVMEGHDRDAEQMRTESSAVVQIQQSKLEAAQQELMEVREALANAEQELNEVRAELHAAQQEVERTANQQQTLAAVAATAADRKSLNRITALEHEVRDRGVTIVKLQKTVKRQEDDLLNYGIALASKQQEIKLLKRSTAAVRKARHTSTAAASTSTATVGGAEGMSTLAC